MDILRKTTGAALAALALAMLPSAAAAQQKFTATVYFDYAFNLTNDGAVTGTQASKDLNNQFKFRRAYFRYENKVGDTLGFRFTYDADNAANITSVSADFTKKTVTTKKDDKLRPYIKHLYLDYTGLLPNSSLRFGMVNTITFQLAEDRWGYRSVAKTLVDGYKDITGVDIRASSADLGFNFTGMATKELRYGVMVTSGEGYSHPEYNNFKKLGGYLQLVPLAGVSLVGYADYEALAGSAKAVTYKADLYLDLIPNLTLAGEYVQYDNETFKNSDSSRYKSSGFSVFGVYKIIVDKLNAFARFDSYQPNSTNSAKSLSLVIVGLDWAPVNAAWKIQPNVWIQSYKDSAKKTDVTGQITFFLSF